MIVGVPRSGTTLLRLMLDRHPELAIPPETWFLADLAALTGRPGVEVDELLGAIMGPGTWPDFGLSVEALRSVLVPGDPAAAARAFYRMYAERHAKPRWGDKTPTDELEAIRRLLPEARFIHVIRDGRDVAASWRTMWFAPSSDVGELAALWRDRIERTRARGERAGHYLEVRYEQLVTDPEPELRRICAHVELAFDPAMLTHHETAVRRLAEHQGRTDSAGRVVLTQEQRLRQQASTMGPLDPSLIGRWRTLLTSDEARRFDDVAGELLATLGYTERSGAAESDR